MQGLGGGAGGPGRERRGDPGQTAQPCRRAVQYAGARGGETLPEWQVELSGCPPGAGRRIFLPRLYASCFPSSGFVKLASARSVPRSH